MDNAKKTLELLLLIDDKYIQRVRVPLNENGWQFGLKHGSVDEFDKSIVEIFNEDGDILATYNNVYGAGRVGPEWMHARPEEIRYVDICLRCGKKSTIKESKDKRGD